MAELVIPVLSKRLPNTFNKGPATETKLQRATVPVSLHKDEEGKGHESLLYFREKHITECGRAHQHTLRRREVERRKKKGVNMRRIW